MTGFVRINRPHAVSPTVHRCQIGPRNRSAPCRSSFNKLRISERTPSDGLFGSCMFCDICDHKMLLPNSILLTYEPAEDASMVISDVSVSAFTPWQNASTIDKPTAITKEVTRTFAQTELFICVLPLRHDIRRNLIALL